MLLFALQLRKSAPHSFIREISPEEANAVPCLLLNAHFDTAIGSPGVSDDRSQVAVLLEVKKLFFLFLGPLPHIKVARAVASTKDLLTPRHGLVVLLNGCEEALQMCSHGFMAARRSPGHSLAQSAARQARAVLNFDSAGAAGPEGQSHPVSEINLNLA